MPLESGYGAPKVREAMGRPVPVPVCATTEEEERARTLASVLKMVNDGIAVSVKMC